MDLAGLAVADFYFASSARAVHFILGHPDTRIGAMFVYDDGIRLQPSRLALDYRHRQAFGYISHAHADHMARHQLALCTRETGELYCYRLGRRDYRTLCYFEPTSIGETQLTAIPAGHMLGSSMLMVEQGGLSMLYTGDFQLAPSRTALPVGVPPHVDVLVMESTFGEPRWTLPEQEATEADLIARIEAAWNDDRVPVIFAYATGKAQEMVALLEERTEARVLQHPKIANISEVYRRCGCQLPEPLRYDGQLAAPGEVVILPPRHHRATFLPCPNRATRIGISGWGIDPRTRHRWEVDYVAPLSDHADFPQLIQLVELVQPRLVFCTHGTPAFYEHLKARGFDAHELDDKAAAIIAGLER